jgi:DMSO/TMAO reductase YedYZ molybdopterin-dependent catalytic subunit
MKIKTIFAGALFGGLLTAPLIAVMFLANQLTGLAFAPFDLFNWTSAVLPGAVVTFGIDSMISVLSSIGLNVADTAKTAEQTMAVGLFLFAGIAAGAVFLAVIEGRKIKASPMDGFVLGMIYGLPITVISVGTGKSTVNPILNFLWLILLFTGWGLAFGWAARRWLSPPVRVESAEEERRVEKVSRREFLIILGGSAAAITVVGSGLGAVLSSVEKRRQQAALNATMAHRSEEGGNISFPNANDPVVPAPGTRPEYTPLKDHYKVFIELEPTVIDGTTWKLPITGLVDNPLMLTLDDLRNNFQPRNQFVTISCISGRIGTSLIGTTLWTGASLQEVLAQAKVKPGARYLYVTSGDGFYEIMDLDLINSDERIMLCYDWDGHPLPVDHGFPLRVWYPDRYGMKQPKWITGMELRDTYEPGYWVERGWDKVAQVKTTSVIDTVAVDAIIENGSQRLIPIGGIAFSGARGISKVEVRVDGGSWETAELRSPLSETTWVIWRYNWPYQAGAHTFEVRCAEGDGTPQIEKEEPSHPSGATGIHKVNKVV